MTEQEAEAIRAQIRVMAEHRNRDLLDAEIAEALATLIKRYPGQRVRVSLVSEAGAPIDYFVSVEHLKSPIDSQCESGKSAHEALEKLIARVGDHNRADYARAEIKRLFEELKAQADIDWCKSVFGIIPAGDECTLLPHERGLTGEPQ